MSCAETGKELSLEDLDFLIRDKHERLEEALRSFMERHERRWQQLLELQSLPLEVREADWSWSMPCDEVVEEVVEAPAAPTASDASLGEGRTNFRLAKSRTTDMRAFETLKKEQVRQRRREWREKVRRFLRHGATELCVAVLTLLSAFVVGVQVEEAAQNVRLPGQRPSLSWTMLNHALTICFTCELLLRVYGFGKLFLCSEEWQWNLLDTIIVFASIVELVLDLRAWMDSGQAGSADLSIIKAMRVVRILRLVRVFRVVRFFRSLRVLIWSILHTLRSVIWALLLLTLIMYTFAILFTYCYTDFVMNSQLQMEEKLRVELKLQEYFGSVPLSMMFLFAAISEGISWTTLTEPLLEAGLIWLLLFLAYVALAIFAVLNVVTGVFCQNAIESATLDQEMVIEAQLKSKKMYMDQVRTLFNIMDEGQSGELTAHAFEEYINEPQVAAYFRALDMDLNNAWKLFTLLDPDDSGTIDLNEFVEGCLKLRGPATRLDMEMVLSVARSTAKRQNQLVGKMEAIEEKLKGRGLSRQPSRQTTFQC